MRVPDKFPSGCRFGERSEGGFFVEFPDKGWFALSSDGKELAARPAMGARGPSSDWFERTEAEFRAAAAANEASAAST